MKLNDALLAKADTKQLLDELVLRQVLVPCSGSMFIDGRAGAKLMQNIADAAGDKGELPENEEEAFNLVEQRFLNYIEVRLLEVMSRGLASAAVEDRPHHFSTEQAHGDYPPDTLFARVELLAVRASYNEGPRA